MTISSLTDAVGDVVTAVGTVVTAIFTSTGALNAIMPVLYLCFAIMLFKMAWGLVMGLMNKRGGRKRK